MDYGKKRKADSYKGSLKLNIVKRRKIKRNGIRPKYDSSNNTTTEATKAVIMTVREAKVLLTIETQSIWHQEQVPNIETSNI